MARNARKNANLILDSVEIESYGDLVDLLVAEKRSPETRRVYRNDIKLFFQEVYKDIPRNVAMEQFLSLNQHEATAVGLRYKSIMLKRGLKANTVNRRLAALRSLIQLARTLGKCNFYLSDVKNEKPSRYRDTSGISKEEMIKVLKIPDRTTKKGKRDYAILLLLWTNGLRRGEVSKLTIGDFDYPGCKLWVISKGRGLDKDAVELPKVTANAIADWLATGTLKSVNSPLFTSTDYANYGHGLTGSMITKLVAKYCKDAGITKPMSAHRLRHACITAALDASNGDVRKVKKLSRHSDLNTLAIYDDNRHRFQGEMSDLLADGLE